MKPLIDLRKRATSPSASVMLALLLLGLAMPAEAVVRPGDLSADAPLELPLLCTFDDDPVDQPPMTGGLHQPSSLIVPPSGTILVRDAALGLTGQPVEIHDGAPCQYGSIDFNLDPIVVGTPRFEATVALDKMVKGYFLQTADSDIVASRFGLTIDGRITDYSGLGSDGTTVGHYQPGVPFRVRVDVDLVAKTWSAVVDEEMDGFADNTVFSGLPFINSPTLIQEIDSLYASLNTNCDQGVTTLVYDDLFALVVEDGPVMSLSGDCPGEITLRYVAGTANGGLGLFFSSSVGTTVLPGGPCAGTTVDLAGAGLLTVLTADSSGDLLLRPTVQAGACGLLLQSVDGSTCRVSNVEVVP